jgi:hypothetical protein
VPAAAPAHSGTATFFNLEGEYAIGHTRLAGEWVRDAFAVAGATPTVSRGFTLQAAETLTPRIFVAARASRASSPLTTAPREVRRSAAAFEATVGYRLTTDLTLRGGYQRERGFADGRWHDSAVMSFVWADRWW